MSSVRSRSCAWLSQSGALAKPCHNATADICFCLQPLTVNCTVVHPAMFVGCMADVVGPSQDSDAEVPEEEQPSVLRSSSSSSVVTPSPNVHKALFQDPSPAEVVKEQKQQEPATVELDGKLTAAEEAKLRAMGKIGSVPTVPKATSKISQAADTGPQSTRPTGLSGDSGHLVVELWTMENQQPKRRRTS